MSDECCTAKASNIIILPCSGGSNVGQLANRAAIELTQEGFGKIFCLAGIGGHLSSFVRSAKDASQVIAIDGCKIGCTRAVLEHTGVPLKSYLVVTDLGIDKNHDFNLKEKEVALVKKAVREICVSGAVQSAD